MNQDLFDMVVVGGGAAGFFAAINLAEQVNNAKIIILEKSNKCLSKVKISGGGRCNVTHACWDPRELVVNYPRGEKALLGPFNSFMCGDMMAWLSDRGVETKIEDDGRVFPESNKSETIIECFYELCKKYNIEIRLSSGMKDFELTEDGIYQIDLGSNKLRAKHLLIATGSSPSVWKLLHAKSINTVAPVPSLFTFNINDPLLKDLPGISFEQAIVKIKNLSLQDSGPLLITHWGLSGPAILKLSAWGARSLAKLNYNFEVIINWTGFSVDETRAELLRFKKDFGNKLLINQRIFDLPKRFWLRVASVGDLVDKNWADLTKSDVEFLVNTLNQCSLKVSGKSTFKEEFVSAGGVDLKQINFKKLEHKNHPNLYFAGEVLDVDAVTGGFNFQAAWTTSWLVAKAVSSRLKTL